MAHVQDRLLPRTGNQYGGTWRAGFRSLQFKASLLVALLIVAVTSAGMALCLRSINVLLQRNEYSRTQDWADSLASGAARAVEAKDRESLTRMVNDLARTRGVAYAAFADASGRVLASAESCAGLLKPVLLPEEGFIDLAPVATPRLVQYGHPKPTCVDVLVPVYSTGAPPPARRTSRPIAGYLRFAADISQTGTQLALIQSQLSRIALGVVLLVVPCSVLVTRRVVAPLNELARTARAIANGSMDARAQVRASNEIGELAESFNTMADRVAETQLELLKLNADLEARVLQRTRELEELAARDPLTGLYNRRHFSEVIAREFAAAERYDADITCLMFDLDRFKEINDRFGHRAGDAVLIALAQAIARELRSADVAARFGGDEFILLLPQTSASSAAVLTDRIVARFTDEAAQSCPGLPASVSIGAASLRTTRAPTAEMLIHEADVALYAAKEGSRERATLAVSAVVTS